MPSVCLAHGLGLVVAVGVDWSLLTTRLHGTPHANARPLHRLCPSLPMALSATRLTPGYTGPGHYAGVGKTCLRTLRAAKNQ